MKPSQYYAHDVAQGLVVKDKDQEKVLAYLDDLYERLTTKNQSKILRWLDSLKQSNSKQGVYLWGNVGRGKTYLMDTFYKSLNVPKLRQHFYEFMAYVHAELKHYQGQAEPLKLVALDLAKRVRILCFDEFFVEDIADAMILGGLFQHLFAHNMMIVATSNVAPDDLYATGLQRDRFLPAIHMIKQYMHVVHLEHDQDYRLVKTLRDHRYHFPLSEAEAFLEAQFNFLNHNAPLLSNDFILNQRNFTAVKRSDTVLWCEFAELCVAARSSLDYLKLANNYKAILINHLPLLASELEDAARRFMTLVDTCYDRHVLLVLAAEVALEELYQGTHLNFEFARVKSRIIEMQSWEI
jgi:cell division protein ZapE